MGLGSKQAVQDAFVLSIVNPVGAAIVAERPIDLGGLGWGVPGKNVAVGELATFQTLGEFRFAKATNVAFVAGQVVWWDSANSRIAAVPAGNAKPLGVVSQPAATADSVAFVNINSQVRSHRLVFVGDITNAGAGLACNTNTGKVPSSVIVQVRSAAGALRTVGSFTLGSGGSAGIITVVGSGTTAGTDIVTLDVSWDS